MRCYVPVLSHTTSTYPYDMFGYELWPNNLRRTIPYVLSTSLEEYYRMTYRSVNQCLGMMYDDLLFVPAFALYASKSAAREALGRFAPLRVFKDLPYAAR